MSPWIMPPPGSILRQRFDQLFHNAGLEPPGDVVDTSEIVLITSMLQMSDALNVMSGDVALRYQELGLLAILPLELDCRMDAFGIIRRRERNLSPGAELLLQAIRRAAAQPLAIQPAPQTDAAFDIAIA
jgi:DNA-binding transcriptional LysR family regulator